MGEVGVNGNVFIPSIDDSHTVSYMAKSEDTGKDKSSGCTFVVHHINMYVFGIYSIESLHLLRTAQNMILIDL